MLQSKGPNLQDNHQEEEFEPELDLFEKTLKKSNIFMDQLYKDDLYQIHV